MRVKRPFIFTNLKKGEGADKIASFIIDKGGLSNSAAQSAGESGSFALRYPELESDDMTGNRWL